jgi:hypothetical protein
MGHDNTPTDDLPQHWIDAVAKFFVDIKVIIDEEATHGDTEMHELMSQFEDLRKKISAKMLSKQ